MSRVLTLSQNKEITSWLSPLNCLSGHCPGRISLLLSANVLYKRFILCPLRLLFTISTSETVIFRKLIGRICLSVYFS